MSTTNLSRRSLLGAGLAGGLLTAMPATGAQALTGDLPRDHFNKHLGTNYVYLHRQGVGWSYYKIGYQFSSNWTLWSYERQSILNIQYRLRARGFNPGVCDGKYGWKTYYAVKRFQRAAGLVDDGKAGYYTVQRMGLNLSA